MKVLIKHLLDNNIDEIVAKSYLNCHCIGLHSIMLLDSPEKTIRMYITTENHEMYEDINLPIAIHPHHCNLTLYCIKGEIFNYNFIKDDVYGTESKIWYYNSKISDGEMRFTKIGTTKIIEMDTELLKKRDSILLEAKQLHTIKVEKGKINAWLVFEGREDKSYIPLCYTNTDLNNVDSSKLYIKPTIKEIKNLIKKSKILL